MQFSIDADAAMNFRRNVPNRERSNIINQFIRRFVDAKEVGEAAQYKAELDALLEEQRALHDRVAEATANLAAAEARDDAREKEEIAQASEMMDSLRQLNRSIDDPKTYQRR